MDDFDEILKISVFNKVKIISQEIKEVTIGPNAVRSRSVTDFKVSPKETAKNDGSKRQSVATDDDGVPVRQIIKILELKSKQEANRALKKRLDAFEQFDKVQEERNKQLWLGTQRAFIEDMEKLERNILQANRQYDLRNSSQQAKLAQQQQEATVRMRKKEEALKAKEKQRQALRDNIEMIKKNQTQFNSEFEQILSTLKTMQAGEDFRTLLGDSIKLLKALPDEMEQVISRCKNAVDLDDEVAKSSEILNSIITLKSTILRTVEDLENKEKQKLDRQKEEKLNIPTVIPGDQNLTPQPTNECVSPSNLQIWTELLDNLKNHSESLRQLEEDSSIKQFRDECRKAVNISVNALSHATPEHILDKYRKLHSLLSGQNITENNKQLNASRHPQGVNFCKDLLARKFVLRGDLMERKTVFCYASMIVSLWNDFPDFGRLLLGYFYKSCPYLVPYYFARRRDESDEDYYKKLGYGFNDGQVERQDKFLDRMTGIIRLYSAILVSKPKRGQNSSPHNLKDGWRLLSSTLRLEPREDITAVTLYTFLETAGFDMDAKYGRVFRKLVKIMLEVFLPKCRQVKSAHGDGAVSRLEGIFAKYLENKKFEKPEGYMEYSFW